MPKILLTNIGKPQLTKVSKDYPVISIRDKYSSVAEIPNKEKRRVLHLCFFASDYMPSVADQDQISKEDVANIIALIKLAAEEGHEKVYVQCGEGRIRSYTLARTITYYHQISDEGILALKGIEVEYCNKESAYHRGIIDRSISSRVESFLEELNNEFRESQQ